MTMKMLRNLAFNNKIDIVDLQDVCATFSIVAGMIDLVEI